MGPYIGNTITPNLLKKSAEVFVAPVFRQNRKV